MSAERPVVVDFSITTAEDARRCRVRCVAVRLLVGASLVLCPSPLGYALNLNHAATPVTAHMPRARVVDEQLRRRAVRTRTRRRRLVAA